MVVCFVLFWFFCTGVVYFFHFEVFDWDFFTSRPLTDCLYMLLIFIRVNRFCLVSINVLSLLLHTYFILIVVFSNFDIFYFVFTT